MKNIMLLLVFFVLTGCQKEEPDPFTNMRFIKFKFFSHAPGDEYYRVNYTFVFEPEQVTESKITVPVEFVGYNLTEKQYFGVRVNQDSTTLPQDCYKLELEQIFAADSGHIDSMRVILLRKPILKEGEKRLRLELVSNADFKTFMPDSSYVDIYVSNILARPIWWNLNVVKAYLGTYSKEKLIAFIDRTGVRDFGGLDSSEKRYYAIKFKRSLEENPLKESDGTPMTVPVSG